MIAVFSETMQGAAALLDRLTVTGKKELGAVTLVNARLNDTDLLVVETGWAKVNLGTAAGIAGALYDLDKIIILGDAGVLKKRGADIGSVAVAETARQYDVDYAPLGYEPSLIIGLTQPQYPCDDALITLAHAQADALGIACYPVNFGSADRFLADATEFEGLGAEFGFEAADTATGALGEYAFLNGIPYLAVKGVSNYGDENAADDWERWHDSADELACRVVYGVLDELTGGGSGGRCTGNDTMSVNIDLARCRELTRAEILSLLPGFTVARLAVCDGDQPYVVPMAFAAKTTGGQISFCLYSEPGGRKLAALADNTRVCLEFDRIDTGSAVSVLAIGTARVTRGCFTSGCSTGLSAVRVEAVTLTGRRCALCEES